MAVLQKSAPEHFASDNSVLLLCGLRDGVLLTFDLKTTDEISLNLRDSAKLGETVVTVTIDSQETNRCMVTCEKEICYYEFQSNQYIEIIMRRIYLTDKNDASLHGITVDALSRIQLQPHVVIAGYSNSILCVSRNELIIAELDKMPRTIPRHISINGTPRRIIFSPRLRLLVVATAQHEREHSFINGKPHYKLTTRASLALIDPDKEYLAPYIDRFEPYELTNSSGKAGLGHAGETIFALTEWDYYTGGKRFSFLLIGTGEIKPQNTTPCNRVIFYQTKREPEGGITLSQRYVLNFANPVCSIAVYNPSTLLFGHGDYLSIRQMNFDTKKFEIIDEYKLQSNVLHISVKNRKIYCSTKNNSLNSYKFENGRLTSYFGDEIDRHSLHHLALPGSNIALLADTDCTLVGLWQPNSPRNESSTTTVFQAELESSITRLRSASVMPTWRSRNPLSQAACSGGPMIIGSSIDGSFYGITLLPESTWRLLKFISNLAVRSRRICPIGTIGNPRLHIEPLIKPKTLMHVNGDILRCVLHLGPEWLEQLLMEDPDPAMSDFLNAEMRFIRFREIVRELFGQEIVGNEVPLAFAFLESLLQPIF
ncbi:MAG: hypothetical protein M1829_002200 [Trizodia sp. TS-e1964]|nr:MAG: hypothetical protein M1829_002200 [Trizodia sp. TS-e1964]